MANLGPVELLFIIGIPVVVGVLIVIAARRGRPSPSGSMMQPGWHPDPNGEANVVRYFDGQRWTDQTRQVDPPA